MKNIFPTIVVVVLLVLAFLLILAHEHLWALVFLLMTTAVRFDG